MKLGVQMNQSLVAEYDQMWISESDVDQGLRCESVSQMWIW